MDLSKYPQARIFETHGVDFSGIRGEELYGNCPFTDKEDKFYVNRKTWLWDSKTAGMSGNIAKFLDEMAREYKEALDVDEVKSLSRHRGLPPSVFRAWGMGWTGDKYSIPIREANGKMTDIRLYNMQRRQMRSTAGCAVGLMGAHLLGEAPNETVYICEGEWDAMALQHLFTTLKHPGRVVAVPGAGTFKKEWVPWMTGRRVVVLYDNDEAGRKGEKMVHDRLHTSVKSMQFVHWPDSLPDGFDIRDWVMYGFKKNTPDLCLERLQILLKKAPRVSAASATQRTKNGIHIRLVAPATTAEKIARPAKVPTLAEVHRVYTKWLHLPNTDAIDVMLAVTLSQQMDGPPVWMFLVGPPGGAKTVTLSGLVDYEHAYNTSSLTAHSLISGANFQGSTDPSLIPRLDQKVLVIKDFTSILGMRDSDKEEIFSILRDAYDGQCGKVFGNGVERSYKSRFTIVAAVTPSIYEIGSRHSALGERFLKYVMGDNLHHHQEEDVISRAIENVDRDTRIREELSRVSAEFLTYGFEELKPAKLDAVTHKQIISLAQLGARLRGTVSRDAYKDEMMTGRPFAEVGSRLGIQLSKISRALAMVRGKSVVTPDEYRVVKKVMIDTVSQRSEDIVRVMHERTVKDPKHPHMTTNEIAHETRYPVTTIRRVMDDLNLLKVVARKGIAGQGFKHVWCLTPYILRVIHESGVYSEPIQRSLRIKRRSPK
jgi:hypothetical protein